MSNGDNEASGRVIYETDPSVEWYTAARLRALATKILGGVDFDPTTCAENPLGAKRFLTALTGPVLESRAHLESALGCWVGEIDALQAPRVPSVFFNPPYGLRIKLWLELLKRLHDRRFVDSLTLVPCRPGTEWYRQITGSEGSDLVCELKGRETFDTRNADGLIVPGRVPARWSSVLLYRSGPLVSAEGLAWVRRQLSTVGDVRLSGRARRARARRLAPNTTPRVVRPADPSQTSLLWPDNVIALAPRGTRA